ncbi:hypothetical protein [Rickettsia parkeri]|nr:hypothetical protein [Rickettsia parkeri]
MIILFLSSSFLIFFFISASFCSALNSGSAERALAESVSISLISGLDA